jgi:hypothetical protein
MDEFGAFLKRINSRKSSGFEAAIAKWMRQFWGSSFKPQMGPEWAGRPSTPIYSPAMSVFGVSTKEEFYNSVEGGDIVNGTLNRFLLVVSDDEPAKRKPTADLDSIPEDIVATIEGIYRRNPIATVCASNGPCAYEVMTWGDGAEAIKDEMDGSIKALATPPMRPFYARTIENAIRAASILALGRGSMAVSAEDMAWGRDLAMWSAARMALECGLYISDSDNQAMAQAVKRVLKEKGPRTPAWVLKRALAHRYRRRDLEDVIQGLVESKEVWKDEPDISGAGRPSVFYSLLKCLQ